MMSLRDQLEAIRSEHGYLDPEVVVDVARDEEHPLHDRFEWDDSVAGEAYRRDQAHRLIQSVRVKYVTDDRPKDVRAFLAVPRADSPRPTYEPVESVMQDDFQRRLVLTQMEREWQTLRSRYGDLVEFGEMVHRDLKGSAA